MREVWLCSPENRGSFAEACICNENKEKRGCHTNKNIVCATAPFFTRTRFIPRKKSSRSTFAEAYYLECEKNN